MLINKRLTANDDPQARSQRDKAIVHGQQQRSNQDRP
jgi:hypothetical protein